MGRRKKENNCSYIDIVISTYVTKKDYEKAQLDFSNELGRYNQNLIDYEKTSKKTCEFIVETESDDDDDID